MKRPFVFFSLFFLYINSLHADEGMWLPSLLQKTGVINDMHRQGLTLSAEEIYSVNHSSLKDAVVLFGSGCTGEIVSEKGLMLTNHHCGYGYIQMHSTLEHNYLEEGFWAKTIDDELPAPGLTASILARMDEVTAAVLEGVTDTMNLQARRDVIKANIQKIILNATQNTVYQASVNDVYEGNQYFLFVYETFKDVRLVGAPPSAIGKFGGDTDNWVWPRHTGDFSVFRIYADSANQPAEYSKNNLPYHPKKHLPISLKGIKKEDFTMVIGFPAKTEEYLIKEGVQLQTEISMPYKIALREIRLSSMNKFMNADPLIRIKYAAKNAQISNAWKKWEGVISGIDRVNALSSIENKTNDFQEWITQDQNKLNEYGDIVPILKELYKKLTPYQLARDFLSEAINGTEIISLAGGFYNLLFKLHTSPQELQILKTKYKVLARAFYKDYYEPLDKEIFAQLMEKYQTVLGSDFSPEWYNKLLQKNKNNFSQLSDYVFSETYFTDSTKLFGLLDNLTIQNQKKISKDPALQIAKSFSELYYARYNPMYISLKNEIDHWQHLYMKGLLEYSNNGNIYPDANFTLRVAYGKVDGYFPRDGVCYSFQSSLEGVIEKDNPLIYDYQVPHKLKELYNAKDYGKYGENGTMPVAFIATNHTSGGNSGSPVLNSNGELIGLNFDRNWEGTMSDFYYDPSICRNIMVDIRYVLFIIDKYAGAHHLIDEMTINE